MVHAVQQVGIDREGDFGFCHRGMTHHHTLAHAQVGGAGTGTGTLEMVDPMTVARRLTATRPGTRLRPSRLTEGLCSSADYLSARRDMRIFSALIGSLMAGMTSAQVMSSLDEASLSTTRVVLSKGGKPHNIGTGVYYMQPESGGKVFMFFVTNHHVLTGHAPGGTRPGGRL